MTIALSRSTENMAFAFHYVGFRGRLVLAFARLLAVERTGASELSVCLMDFYLYDTSFLSLL
jgi:hypothetical protein